MLIYASSHLNIFQYFLSIETLLALILGNIYFYKFPLNWLAKIHNFYSFTLRMGVGRQDILIFIHKIKMFPFLCFGWFDSSKSAASQLTVHLWWWWWEWWFRTWAFWSAAPNYWFTLYKQKHMEIMKNSECWLTFHDNFSQVWPFFPHLPGNP